MHFMEFKPFSLRLVSLITALALAGSLGLSASHCATFAEGKKVLEESAAHAHHHMMGHGGHHSASGEPAPRSSSVPEPPKGGQGSDHCQYCQAATGCELAPAALVFSDEPIIWQQPLFILPFVSIPPALHSAPRGPPSFFV